LCCYAAKQCKGALKVESIAVLRLQGVAVAATQPSIKAQYRKAAVQHCLIAKKRTLSFLRMVVSVPKTVSAEAVALLCGVGLAAGEKLKIKI